MSIVRILDRMESDGLLERRPDPADRRARCLYLTPKAKPLLEQIWRVSDATRAQAFTGIGRAERDVFLAAMDQMHQNLSAPLGKSTPP
jgi:MarR family transcriptional regulator for hemolysin